MNIIIITPYLPYPPTGGTNYYIWKRIEYFHQKNYKVHIFAKKPFIRKIGDYSELTKYCENLSVYRNSIVNIITKPFLSQYVAQKYSRQMKKDITNLINNKKIDLIICDFPFMLINLPDKLSVPVVLTQHNLEFQKIERIARSKRGLLKWLLLFESHKLKAYESKIVSSNKIAAYTFISEDNKKQFEHDYGKENTYLLPVGYDIINRGQSSYKEGKIVYAGSMDYAPNIEAVKWFCKDIFPEIREKFPESKFVIIGRNPTKEVLSLKSDYVEVTGTVDNVLDYILDAHLYVIPLKSGDGVKIKTIEAFASGNIIVSTDIGIEGTKFVHNEDFILANGKNQFVDACQSILENRKKYEDLALNATKVIQKHYSWDAIWASYDEYIRSLF
jgi:glycosyltransferase involved in cell wall biosynthesis